MKRIAFTLALALSLAFAIARPAFAIDDREWDHVIETRSARDARKRELETLKSSLAQAATRVNGVRDELEAQRRELEKLRDAHKDLVQIAEAEAQLKWDGEELAAQPNEAKLVDDEIAKLETAGTAAVKSLSKTDPAPDNTVATALKGVTTEIENAIKTLAETRTQLTKVDASASVAGATAALAGAETAYEDAQDEYTRASKPSGTLSQRLWSSRRLRCMTAYCYGGDDGTKYGIEPVLDLPFGVVWSSGGGALRSYVNSHTFNIEFNAGLRYWFAYDTASVMVYISRPVIESKDSIQVAGSPFQHEPSAIRRPYPSIGVGLFGDVLLLGVSLDELRNGTTDQNRDPKYPSGEVLSRSLTFSLGFSIVNTARNVADSASKPSEGDK